eukprot:jgi/Ulvmu1/9745/UM055_0085.1
MWRAHGCSSDAMAHGRAANVFLAGGTPASGARLLCCVLIFCFSPYLTAIGKAAALVTSGVPSALPRCVFMKIRARPPHSIHEESSSKRNHMRAQNCSMVDMQCELQLQ